MSYQNERRQQLIEKLVSNAKAIISNQVALPLGVQKMNKIIRWINDIEPLKEDLSIFRDYDINTDDLPLGTERLNWNIEKLIEIESEFDQANLLFKADILRKCKSLIATFSK
jgi:hypothetical protein